MSHFGTCTKAVLLLLKEIDPTIENFEGLEEKKISPALLAFTAESAMRLCVAAEKICCALDKIINDARRKDPGYFQEGKEGDGI